MCLEGSRNSKKARVAGASLWSRREMGPSSMENGLWQHRDKSGKNDQKATGE